MKINKLYCILISRRNQIGGIHSERDIPFRNHPLPLLCYSECRVVCFLSLFFLIFCPFSDVFAFGRQLGHRPQEMKLASPS